MNAVGIDVSKGKSTVAILRSMGEVVQAPVDVPHDTVSLERLVCQILALGENIRVLLETIGRYHELTVLLFPFLDGIVSNFSHLGLDFLFADFLNQSEAS